VQSGKFIKKEDAPVLTNQLLDPIPLWVLFVLIMLTLLLAMEVVGYRVPGHSPEIAG
jgi:hypothetical protein